MHSSKLLTLLERLSKRQMATLADVVHSPFFTKNQSVVLLFEALAIHYPDFSSCTREDLFHSVFPSKPFNDLKLRHLMSILLGLAEQSLVVPPFLERVEAARDLATVMSEMELPKHYRSAMRRYDRLLKEAPGLSPELSYDAFRFGILREREPMHSAEVASLVDAHSHLDDFYLSSKLRQACISFSRKHTSQKDLSTPLLEEILSHLSTSPPRSPLVSLYHLALLAQLHPSETEYFRKLKGALGIYDSALSPELAKELHILARNHCIRRMNSGDAHFTEELFDLYKGAMKKGLLHAADGHFSPSSFKNIVSTGLKLKAFGEVEAFIEGFGESLPEAFRSDYIHFSLGKLRFEQRDFREVPAHLRKVLYRDPFIQLDSRVLLMKTWYEMDQLELLESAIERNRKFVQRWKFQAYHRENYQHILKAMEGLVAVAGLGTEPRRRLREQVGEMEPLTEKAWFLEKLD